MSKLVVISNSQAGLSHPLGKQWVTIGRAPGNAFQIVESSVSGHHCEVLLRGNELAVRDMRSTNGTFIDGKLIVEGVLKKGQVLRLGDVELRMELTDPEPISISIYGPDEHRNQHNGGPDGMSSAAGGDSEPRKHQVLLVDDSMAFLEMAAELFEAFSNGEWEVHKASGADTALAIVQQKRIEIAVLDINMPILDGVQLLGMLHRRHPEVKKVILTGSGQEAQRTHCLANGAELFLEKPVARDGLRFVFNVLNDLISWKHREGFSGTLQQVALADIIQIECLRRNSCILEIKTSQSQGEIYIESGVIKHAVTGSISGEEALHRLLSLNNGQFQFYPYRQPPERTVHGTWECLLMESARIRDEEKSARGDDKTTLLKKSDTEMNAEQSEALSTPLISDF